MASCRHGDAAVDGERGPQRTELRGGLGGLGRRIRSADDAGAGKQTLVSKLGIDGARKVLSDTVNEAVQALRTFGPKADGLRATARYFASREK